MNTVGQVRFYNGLPIIRKSALALVQLTLEYEATFKDDDISTELRSIMLEIEINEAKQELSKLISRLAATGHNGD